MVVEDRRADRAVEKIMAGTMRALSRQGTYKLSVSDICQSSGVARGTFYRYFTSKDDALAALGQHIEDGVAFAFAAAIEKNPKPSQRVQVVLDAIITYRGSGADFARMLDVAPEFTLEFMRETFPNLVDAATDALGPAADESPLVTGGAMSKRQLGDLFMRAVISMLLLPGSRSSEVPEIIASLFKVGAVAQPKAKQRRRRAARKAS
jgi:AcrR family transcriptional regulator